MCDGFLITIIQSNRPLLNFGVSLATGNQNFYLLFLDFPSRQKFLRPVISGGLSFVYKFKYNLIIFLWLHKLYNEIKQKYTFKFVREDNLQARPRDVWNTLAAR